MLNVRWPSWRAKAPRTSGGRKLTPPSPACGGSTPNDLRGDGGADPPRLKARRKPRTSAPPPTAACGVGHLPHPAGGGGEDWAPRTTGGRIGTYHRGSALVAQGIRAPASGAGCAGSNPAGGTNGLAFSEPSRDVAVGRLLDLLGDSGQVEVEVAGDRLAGRPGLEGQVLRGGCESVSETPVDWGP